MPSFSAVLMRLCSWEGIGEDRETRTLRSQALSRKRFSWGAGQVLRSRGAWPPARETARVRVVTGGTVPSYPAPVMPHPPGLRLLRQGVFPWGPSGAAIVTGRALGTKAGRAALRTGLSAAARDAPGRCSTVGGGSELTWAGDPLPSHCALLLASPHFHAPRLLSRRDQVLHVLQLYADKEPLRN